ncbi:ankyrin repeat protein, putative [Trichomonas vaginalis G3]|uniref:Ankyrin repeat protein, putative n=1 Tax=Trichomonas vaginalis (strain ATCC PRA-98 / G3) TaxID=412133 RepID=A2F2P4_TRIV3|nr:ankyrin repeat protein family [Trichomonas vaginalis G3]EAY00818.1 ankyrin repeat protein, putative [Trichomonas vaginalis G3]KAI5492102.1 ankyrin repeat protein family [Trichomonas vaginalis G3]|eukprot:XP_001313747.1 ankyrin repeat protein [Trichomonas vaginalis G3]
MTEYNFDQFITEFGNYIDAIDTIYKLNTTNQGEVEKVYYIIKRNLINRQVYSPTRIISILYDVMLSRYHVFKSYLLIIKWIIDDYNLQSLDNCNSTLYFFLYKEFKMIFENRCYNNPYQTSPPFLGDNDYEIPMINAIIYDDITLFISSTELHSTNLNHLNALFFTGKFDKQSKVSLRKFTLLEFCCLHGAVKCFKYLRTEYKSNVTKKCLQYSFISGVPDILNECLKYQKPNEKCMKYAIISHNIDFVTFLMNEYNLQIDINYCAKFKNISAFFVYMNEKFDMNSIDSPNCFYCSLLFAIPSLVNFFFLKSNKFIEKIDKQKAISITINNKCYELIELIASIGANLDKQKENGKTFLHQAAERNDLELINELISQGANMNAKDVLGKTALHYATIHNHIDSVQALLSRGAKVCLKDHYYGKTPLHYAVDNNNIKIIKLLFTHGANANSYDINFQTALHFAAERNNVEITELLILHDANVNAKNKDGKTPLHYASINNCQEVGNLLILKGSYLDAKDKNGRTPLHYAAYAKKKEFVEILIASRADIDIKDIENKTPLHYAVENGNIETAQILISTGANTNAKDKYGKAPLHYAAKNNNIEIAKILLAQRGRINAKDICGNTPLHIAAINGSIGVIKFLIDNGARVNSLNILDQTPLHFASMVGYIESIKILLSYKANPNLIDRKGISPISYAKQNMNLKELISTFGLTRYIKDTSNSLAYRAIKLWQSQREPR